MAGPQRSAPGRTSDASRTTGARISAASVETRIEDRRKFRTATTAAISPTVARAHRASRNNRNKMLSGPGSARMVVLPTGRAPRHAGSDRTIRRQTGPRRTGDPATGGRTLLRHGRRSLNPRRNPTIAEGVLSGKRARTFHSRARPNRRATTSETRVAVPTIEGSTIAATIGRR